MGALSGRRPAGAPANSREGSFNTAVLLSFSRSASRKRTERSLQPSYVSPVRRRTTIPDASPPDAQRIIRKKGTTWVSFMVEADGSVRPGSLKVNISSGTSAYDAAALRTVEKNAPFNPPPRSMPLAVPIDYFPN
ncbi:energy transducer TonB family protein [Xanthobacter sediminis]